MESLEKIKEWAERATSARRIVNARSDADAAAACETGEGAFVLGGNWNACIVKDGLEDAAFFDMPPGDSGKAVAIGSASIPYHISAKSKNPDLAAAYLDFITGPTACEALVDTQESRPPPTAPRPLGIRSARTSRTAGTSSSRRAA